jgi:hypothetical protein
MLLPADLHALGQDLRRAAARKARHRRRTAVAFVATAVLGACAGVAMAAASLLGSPAPQGAQIDLHRAVGWVNAKGLRLQTAKIVAVSPAATLYSIADRRGNYCLELIGHTKGVIFGFGCESTQVAPSGQLLFSGSAPGASYVDGPDGTSPPIVQFGRLPPHTVSARATYDNGVQERIPIGLDRFFIYQPSPRLQALARRMPMTLEFNDGHGAIWSYYQQPPQPLRIDGEHHISGRVVIDHAEKVEIDVAPHVGALARQVYVPLHADGTFSWTGRPGDVVYRLTVRDAEGEPLSADTGVLTPRVVSEMSALAK